jgi:CBS domain-containing protein
MNVRVILSRKGADVVTIQRRVPITEALSVLAEHNVGALVVCDDRAAKVDGIISERDIVRRMAESGAETLQMTVEDVMTSNVLTCDPDATADEVMQVMTTHRARHLPVLDGGRLAGIVSIGDVVKSRIDDLETQTQSMQEYISGSAY